MEFRNLGRTGVKVSPLCLGCWNFGNATSREDSLAIIDHALDAGINFVDTANSYGRGTSETIVGEALREPSRRQRVVLATKVHFAMDDEEPNAQGNSRRHILEQCEASLRRLQTEYIDLYQIHRPSPDVPPDETLRALDDLVRSGKVRYIGTSTWPAWQVVESLWVAEKLSLNRPICEQPPYHLLDRRIERELVPMAQTYGIGIIPWAPLASGFLTGIYQRDAAAPPGTRFEKNPETQEQRNLHSEAAFAVLDEVSAIANEKGCSPGQLALAWNMAQPGITAPIVGPRTLDHWKGNLGALEVSVTNTDRERLDAVAPPGRAIAPYYEARWGPRTFR